MQSVKLENNIYIACHLCYTRSRIRHHLFFLSSIISSNSTSLQHPPNLLVFTIITAYISIFLHKNPSFSNLLMFFFNIRSFDVYKNACNLIFINLPQILQYLRKCHISLYTLQNCTRTIDTDKTALNLFEKMPTFDRLQK